MDYAERILALSEEMDTRVGDLTGAVAGPLLLGASTTIAEFILPQILGEFKAAHPEVEAHMTVANSETIVNRVADHTIDVGLIESPTYLPSLQNEVCCDDELVLICAPGHALAGRKSIRAQEIAATPMVRREPGSGTREFTDNYFRQCGVPPEDLNVMMELGSPEAMKGVVETGIAVVDRFAGNDREGAEARIAGRRAARRRRSCARSRSCIPRRNSGRACSRRSSISRPRRMREMAESAAAAATR